MIEIPGASETEVVEWAEGPFEVLRVLAEDVLDGARGMDPAGIRRHVEDTWATFRTRFEAIAADFAEKGGAFQRDRLGEAGMPSDFNPLRDPRMIRDMAEAATVLTSLGARLADRAIEAYEKPQAVAAANEPTDEEREDAVAGAFPLFRPRLHSTTLSLAGMLALGAGALIMSDMAARLGGLVWKEWRAILDDRTRTSHRNVHGEKKRLSEPFSNGILFPRDSLGPPEEVINCRCHLTYTLGVGGFAASIGGIMSKWEGVIAVEGEKTGDGRRVARGALTWKDDSFPLPFKLEHEGPTVGQIDEIWRDGANIRARGVFHVDTEDPDTLKHVTRAMELLPVWGVSVELDDDDVEVRMKADVWKQMQADWEELRGEKELEDTGELAGDGSVVVERHESDDIMFVVTSARIRGAALVDTAAFIDAGAVAASVGLVSSGRIALAASGGVSPFRNPNYGADGNEDPRLVWQTPTRPEEIAGWGAPFTVHDDGTVEGHLALNFRCHGAYASCVLPPTSDGDYSYFLTGEAEKGTATGPLVIGTTHGVKGDGTYSHDHLANTGKAVADVVVGPDRHGVWCAGKLRPGVTEAQIAELRGSTLSGEWHPIGPGGRLRLVGVLAVNSPGYLVQRYALAASNEPMFTVGATCCPPEDGRTVEERLSAIEKATHYLLTREDA